MGGFHVCIKFGIAVVPLSTQTRWFVGLSTATSNLSATTDPTSLTNLFGVGCNAADTNIRWLNNDGTSTATTTDLGTNFPGKTAATWFYELNLFAASGRGLELYWGLQRLNDSAYASGGPITTDIPALSTLMAWHVNIGNGTQAAAASIDLGSVYTETDN